MLRDLLLAVFRALVYSDFECRKITEGPLSTGKFDTHTESQIIESINTDIGSILFLYGRTDIAFSKDLLYWEKIYQIPEDFWTTRRFPEMRDAIEMMCEYVLGEHAFKRSKIMTDFYLEESRYNHIRIDRSFLYGKLVYTMIVNFEREDEYRVELVQNRVDGRFYLLEKYKRVSERASWTMDEVLDNPRELFEIQCELQSGLSPPVDWSRIVR
jgi:hypothetical protein